MFTHSLDPTVGLTSVDFLLRFDWHIHADTSGRSGPVTVVDGPCSVSSIAQDSCESRRTDRHWWVKHCWYLRHLRISDNHLFWVHRQTSESDQPNSCTKKQGSIEKKTFVSAVFTDLILQCRYPNDLRNIEKWFLETVILLVSRDSLHWRCRFHSKPSLLLQRVMEERVSELARSSYDWNGWWWD